MTSILVIYQFRSLHESLTAIGLTALVGSLASLFAEIEIILFIKCVNRYYSDAYVAPDVAPEISLMNERLRADMTCVRSLA